MRKRYMHVTVAGLDKTRITRTVALSVTGLVLAAGSLVSPYVQAVSPVGPSQFGSVTTLAELFPVFPSTQTAVDNPLVADVNNDGNQDVLTVETASGATRTYIRTRLGNGDGTVGETKTTTTPFLSSFVVMDIDNNGVKDVVSVSAQGNSANGNLGTFEVRSGNNDGTFTEMPSQTIATPGYAYLYVKDINNDGKTDVVASYLRSLNSISTVDPVAITYFNDGSGQFTAAPAVALSVTETQKVLAVEDLNSDGKLDLLVGSVTAQGAVWFGDGAGNFTKSTGLSINGVSFRASLWSESAVADFTGDGKLDIAVIFNSTNTNADVNAVRIYANQGNGTFSPEITSARTTIASELRAVNVNNDGFTDLYAMNGNGASVYLGDGAGHLTGVQDIYVESSYPVTAGDLNNDMNLDLVFNARATSSNPSRLAASLNLTPQPDTALPQVVGSTSTSPNTASWFNQDTSINWTSTDPAPSSGTPTQPPDTTVSSEGINTYTSEPSCDPAGNCATGSLEVKLDKTAPELGVPAWSSNPKATNGTTTLTISASDGLSGISEGEYFIGTDPGEGNGATLTAAGGNYTTAFGVNFVPGVYDIGLRVKDVAGNWSAATKTMLVVFDPAGAGITGKNKKDLIPSLANGDVLPGLTSQGQNSAVDYGFTVEYQNGGLDPRNDFQLAYSTGSRCNSPNADNCHSFSLNATSFGWLVVDQTNDSRGRFQGVASLTVDGVTTANSFTVMATDGDRLTPTNDDNLIVQVFAPGANPGTAQPIYKVSGVVTQGGGVRIR